MTAAQRAKYKRLLEGLQAELLGKGREKLEPNRASDNEQADEDEQPLNEMLQSIASKRNQSHGQILARVQKALAKLKGDPEEFGLCEDCGEELPLGRLSAMPYAELCVACQSGKDAPKGSPTRRKLTDYR